MAIIQRFFPTTSGSFAGNGSGLTNVTATTALTATSASYALTASYALNGGGGGGSTTGSFTGSFTGSLNGTASYASTASYVLNAISSSFSTTASYALNSDKLNGYNSTYFATTGSNTFVGTQDISGSLQLNPTQDPGTSNISSSFLFVSTSADNAEFNLHYRNNGALWETHWLEELTDTGLVWGGVLTFTGTTMSITPGAGLIIDHNASTSSHGDTTPTYIQFGPITASATFITSSQVTYLLIDTNGSLIQQTTPFTPQQFNEKLPLGYIFCLTTSSISSYADARITTYGQNEQQSQFIRAFGPLKINGYDITPQSGSLKISISSGRTYRLGGFYTQDPDDPSIYDSANIPTGSLVRIYRDPAAVGGFRAATNGGIPYTDIDPTLWDDGSGTLQNVADNEWTIQRLFQGVVNNITYVYYGQNVYDSLNAAIQSITTEAFEESQTSIIALPFIGYVIAKGNTTNLSDTTNNKIINSGLFRNTAGSSGGGGVATTNLNDLADVNITSPLNGEALVYNAGLWVNANPTSASYSETSSYVENAQTASYVLNAVSSSYALTASYVQTAQTASYVLNAISASYIENAQTASYVNQAVSSSYAISASRADSIPLSGAGNGEIQFNTGGILNSSPRIYINSSILSVTNGATLNATGSLLGTSSYADTALSSSFAITASYASTAQTLLGSVTNADTASFVTSSNIYGPYGSNSILSASFAVSASWAPGGSGITINDNTNNNLITATGTANTLNGESNLTFNGSTLTVTGDVVANSFTGSLQGTASFAASASYAVTSSFASSSPENSSTSGVGTTPTATQTDTVTHGLGRIPVKIRIYGAAQFTSNASATPTPFSIGTWTSSGNRCIYQPIGGAITTSATAATSTTFAIRIDTAAGSRVEGVIQNVGATTFDISWTETGTAAARVYLWEAE